MSWISAFQNRANTYADAFQAKDITSPTMTEAIREWFGLYYMTAATEEEDPCQQIPFTIIRKLTRAGFAEYKYTASDKYAEKILDSLNKETREAFLQKLMIGGEAMLKPVPTQTGWSWTVIDRCSMMVFGRSRDGKVMDVGTVETCNRGRWFYTLAERRTVADGYLTIRNMLFRADRRDVVGVRVPLAELPEYEQLPDEYTYTERMDSLGLIQVRMPVANCVDGSSDGVSVYAPAVQAIHNINRNEAQLSGEFNRGESRVFASSDLFEKKKGKDGKMRPVLTDTIFTAVDTGPEDVPITIFSPELRDEAFKRRRDGYLRSIESIIGLQRGILSDVQEQERTATEITSSKGDYALTVEDLQQVWADTVKEAMRLCGILGTMYHVPEAHEVKEDGWVVDYGDGILYDPDKEEQRLLNMVAQGLLQPERYLGWHFNLPANTEAERAKIRKDYMPETVEDS